MMMHKQKETHIIGLTLTGINHILIHPAQASEMQTEVGEKRLEMDIRDKMELKGPG